MLSLIVAIVTTNSCTNKALGEKACVLRGETCKEIFQQGQNDTVILDAEMARDLRLKAEVVCLFH